MFTLCFLLITGQLLAQDQAIIEAKIKALNEEMSKKMMEGDFSTDLYAVDAISMPNQQPMLEGIEAIKASNENAIEAGIKFESFDITPKKIMVNGKMVTEIGNYSMSMRLPNSSMYAEDGKYLTLWEIQEDGELKIKVEIWNTNSMPQM